MVVTSENVTLVSPVAQPVSVAKPCTCGVKLTGHSPWRFGGHVSTGTDVHTTTALAVAVHWLKSVTVTEKVPLASPPMDAVVAPLLQRYV